MQKVYLLLRNNQQTGPHSFEELLQLQLKPLDLVWVEGKSYGWRYPTEVETLKHYFTVPEEAARQEAVEPIKPIIPTPVETVFPNVVNVPKKVFVSLPSNVSGPSLQKQPAVDPIEQKAEELRKRAQAYVPQQEPLQTNYNRKLQEAEEEYTHWIYQKKTKKKTGLNKNWLAVAVVSGVIVLGGWWAFNNFFNAQSEKPLTVQQTEKEAVTDTTSSEPATIDETVPTENISVLNTDPSSSINPTETKKEIIKVSMDKKLHAQQETAIPSEVAMAEDPVEKPMNNTTSAEPEMEVVTVEKKKTLKEKLGGLFKKPKSDATADESQTKSAENDYGERTATRRNENTESNPVITDVSDQVEIKTNKIADSWMMGVKNLKLTLYNRSDLTINSAKVEVLYYSEQNNLLEKKILSFSNVPPKKSQTVPAPDQRLADHIEFKVISATGTENAYAKQ